MRQTPFTKGNTYGNRFACDEKTREAGRKGGLNKKKNSEAKRNLIQELEYLLEIGDTTEKISVAILNKALKGDLRAYEVIRDTIGLKPVEKVAQTDAEGNVIEPAPTFNILAVQTTQSEESKNENRNIEIIEQKSGK